MATVTSYNSSYIELSDGDESWSGTAPTGPSGGSHSCDVPQDTSNSLRLYNYGFSIPDEAINGIIVNIYCSSSRADIMVVQLYDGTSLVGSTKNGVWNSNQIFGTSSDMWGTSLTYDKINLTNFGVRIYGTGIANGSSITLIRSEITVNYGAGDPGGGGSGTKFLFNIF